MKLSRAEKRAVQSHIVSHVKEKLQKSTKRSDVIIQLNPATPGGILDFKRQGCSKDFLGFEILNFLISLERKILVSTFLGSLI